MATIKTQKRNTGSILKQSRRRLILFWDENVTESGHVTL